MVGKTFIFAVFSTLTLLWLLQHLMLFNIFAILMPANSKSHSDNVEVLVVDQEFVGLHNAMWNGVCPLADCFSVFYLLRKTSLNGDFSWLLTKIMLTEDKTVSCTEFDCAPCKVQFKLFWRAVVKCGSRSSLPSSNMNG